MYSIRDIYWRWFGPKPKPTAKKQKSMNKWAYHIEIMPPKTIIKLWHSTPLAKLTTIELALCLIWKNEAPRSRARSSTSFNTSTSSHEALDRPEAHRIAHKESSSDRICQRFKWKASKRLIIRVNISTLLTERKPIGSDKDSIEELAVPWMISSTPMDKNSSHGHCCGRTLKNGT